MSELNITRTEIEDALHAFVHMWCDIDHMRDRGHEGLTFEWDPKAVDAVLQKVFDHVRGKG